MHLRNRSGPQAVQLSDEAQLSEDPFEPGGMILQASGELDAAGAPSLRERLNAAIDSGRNRVVVDFSEVSFVDSLSLAAVVRAQARLEGRGRLALVAAHPYVLLILQAGGLESVLDVCTTQAEAMEHVKR